MGFGFGGGFGEGGNGVGTGGGIGEGGMGSGDGAGTGSGGIGCGGNGSRSGEPVMESDSARQGNGRRSINTNWAVTIADNPQNPFRVFIGNNRDPFVAFVSKASLVYWTSGFEPPRKRPSLVTSPIMTRSNSRMPGRSTILRIGVIACSKHHSALGIFLVCGTASRSRIKVLSEGHHLGLTPFSDY
jgi:hypothetical protein